jgi:hypothetical protein
MEHTLAITKIVVLLRKGHMDMVWVSTSLPSTVPAVTADPLTLQFDACQGTGVEYVRQHFGIEPEVIQG